MFAIKRIPAGTFDDLVQGTHAAGMSSYAHSRYDNGRFREMVFEAAARADAPDTSYFFNNVRTTPSDWSLLQHNSDPVGLRRLAAAEQASVVDTWSAQHSTLFFHLHPAELDCRMILNCVDSVIPAQTAAQVLRHMRDLMVDAGIDPSTRAGPSPTAGRSRAAG
jgi:hypothetical protein